MCVFVNIHKKKFNFYIKKQIETRRNTHAQTHVPHIQIYENKTHTTTYLITFKKIIKTNKKHNVDINVGKVINKLCLYAHLHTHTDTFIHMWHIRTNVKHLHTHLKQLYTFKHTQLHTTYVCTNTHTWKHLKKKQVYVF